MAQLSTVVLIPGLLCDADVWAAQAQALSGACRVLSPGFMDHPSIEAMAEEILRLAPERFSVAGHSMGGRVALELVRRAPSRIERLALLDTGFHAARPGEETGRRALIEIAAAQGMSALAKAWLPPMMSERGLADDGLVARLTAMIERANVDLFRRQIRALLTRPNAASQLAAIPCETSVIVGRQDAWSPVEQHRQMAAHIPEARLVVIEDCGHMSLVEQPAAVSAALLDWIQRPVIEAPANTGRYLEPAAARTA